MQDPTQSQATTSSRARGKRSSTSASPRGPRSWSPFQTGATPGPDEERYWLEREMSLLERALADKGEMRRGELGDLVGCKYWGPGRYARALKIATSHGRIKHIGFGRYGPNS
jgi:hypothetical protein